MPTPSICNVVIQRQNEKKKISKSLQNNEAAIRDLILTSLSCINDMQSIEAKTRCEMLYSTENELNGMTNITPKSFLDCGINRENKNNPEQQDIILIAEGSLIYETCRFIENENKKVT